MRKFSNKSKKEKKNAIRRKTKDNRRNNKRRTYRKKMKGGDTHPAAQRVIDLVNELETNVNNLINVINSITGEDIKVHNEVNRNLKIVKEILEELSKKKGSCRYDITVKNMYKLKFFKDKDIACEESKKESYIKAVTNMQNLKNAAETKVEELEKSKDLKLKRDLLTAFVIIPIKDVIKISKTGIENMEKKATSRGIENIENIEKNATSSGDEELDIIKIYSGNKAE